MGLQVFVFLLIDEMGIAVGGIIGLVVVDDDVLLLVIISTGFLERFLPLCMCLSQYLESG